MFSPLVYFLFVSAVTSICHEPSPAFPLPKYDPRHPSLQKALAEIEAALATTIAAPEHAKVSFSVEVTSSKESLWSLHHTARERNASRHDVEKIDGDTLYRIASITKSFTVLGLLYQHAAGNLSLDDTIDKYIEELREKQNGTIPWKDITLRSLASQLSGIQRDWAQGDLINMQDPWKYGLPPLSRDGLVECDEFAPNYDPPCSKKVFLREDLLDHIRTRDPLFAPNQKSSYSNVAFELLGLVLENVTGQSFASYISQAIFEPLSMDKSALTKPPDSHGVIPKGPQYWDVDEGVQNPTGGIYSSSADMSKFLRYVLTHYNGITHATNWIHPASPSGGLHSFYGMPWEIFRTASILPDSNRPINIVTKGGGVPGYLSYIIFLPEYDLGITLLVAGDAGSFIKALRETVVVSLVRAAENVAIEQFQKRYEGVYTSTDPDLNSSVTLVFDTRGLVVTQFVSNSTDVFASGMPEAAGAPKDGRWYAQLVPTLLYRDQESQEGELWRMELVAERNTNNKDIFDDFCTMNADIASYAALPLNEFVLWEGENKQTEIVEPTAFRVKLNRTREEHTLVELTELK